MITSLRGAFIVAGCVGLALTANIAIAQSGSSGTGGERDAEGSQGVQEKMYEDRMKDFQETQSQQGIEGQTQGQQGMGDSDPALQGRSRRFSGSVRDDRSRSRMEHDKRGDKMMSDEKGKSKERK